MRRYAEATLRFGVVTSFTLFFGGLSVTAVEEPGAGVQQIGQDGEPSVVITLASAHPADFASDLSEPTAMSVAPRKRTTQSTIAALLDEPIAGLVSFVERWSARAVDSDGEPAVVVRLASLPARAVSDDGAPGEETVALFAPIEPVKPNTLAALRKDPIIGATSFVQRWSAYADVAPDGEPRAVITLASLPPVQRKAVAWQEPAVDPVGPSNENKVAAAPVDTAGGAIASAAEGDASASLRIIDALACLRSTIIGQLAKLDGSALMARNEYIVGVASFYDDVQETASGEAYDPQAFTAAAQLDIRDKFGGIRFGKNYQPAYAVAEYDGKRIIVKFNDVGPLRPGRSFDLSRAAMAYLGGLDKGLLEEVRVTPLPLGYAYTAGPVSDEQAAALLEDVRRQKQITRVSSLQ